MRYRIFGYYKTPEQLDAEALARLRTVLDGELFDLSPPSDVEAAAIDRALAAERIRRALRAAT